MNQIICPHCGKGFSVSEAGYADLLKQVRDSDFERELHDRLEQAEAAARATAERDQARAAVELQAAVAAKDAAIHQLNARVEAAEVAQRLAVADALRSIERERDALASQLAQAQQELRTAAQLADARLINELQSSAATKEAEIQALKSQLDTDRLAHHLAIAEAVATVARERDELRTHLERDTLTRQLTEQQLKAGYEAQLKDRDETITRLHDLRARLSTKMVGETLEQHCETEFNRIRATAFPRAYFEKDNDARTGSKGDYVFRDTDEAGTEVVSIMFEMKNESATSSTRQKNEDFLRELDKDRTEKGCEYAVLVSLLEPDSDLYNTGIIDVSHRFPKMYVVRPQFFIPIITLLRNAALNAARYKAELAQVRAQNIDITNFEDRLNAFRNSFGRNWRLASERFTEAIRRIDDAIRDLERTKQALLDSNRHLRLANDRADRLTIRGLIRDNPTMAAKFAALEAQKDKARMAEKPLVDDDPDSDEPPPSGED